MKIQIDTSAKTIKIEDSVALAQFFKEIKRLLPDWEEYKLETNTVIYNWTNPIYPQPYINPWPLSPWSPNPFSPIYTNGDITAIGGTTATGIINYQLD